MIFYNQFYFTGAHFLLATVKKFDEIFNSPLKAENKFIDNVSLVLAQLYNFKLYHSRLIFHIMTKFTENFEEKDVECLLHILKGVGFTLRKDDPVSLKNLILSIQKQAMSVPVETQIDR